MVHSPESFTHLSLFSGIGGLDLAAEWAGFQTVGQCEWADYPTKVLEKHWPGVPRWRDIRTLTKESFHERTGLRTVDVISGGFPCQPFSLAGKRRGSEDDRYLWPEMLRVIKELRPCWVIGENVAGIVNMALDTVLSDLESIGYATQAFIIPACAVDAPHRRDRCAIVAHADGGGHLHGESEINTTKTREYAQREPLNRRSDVSNANGQRRKEFQLAEISEKPGQSGGTAYAGNVPNADGFNGRTRRAEREGQPRETGATYGGFNVPDPHDRRRPMRRQRELSAVEEAGSVGRNHGGGAPEHGSGERRAAKPGLGGVADGFPHWLDEPLNLPRIARGIKNRVGRLKCLGNAVVPQQFYPIFRAISEIERSGNNAEI